MKRKRLLIWIVFVGLLLGILFKSGDYSYSEAAAMRKASLNQAGEVVFKQNYGSKAAVIWQSGARSYAAIVYNKWLRFYSTKSISEIAQSEPEDAIRRSWSASLNGNGRYDTLLAAITNDPNVKKIVFSNEGPDLKLDRLEDVKAAATLFVEVEVSHGYAAAYASLAPAETGKFVYRGINEQGEIIAVKWY